MRVTRLINHLQLFVMVYLNIYAPSKPRSSSPFTLICLGLPLLFFLGQEVTYLYHFLKKKSVCWFRGLHLWKIYLVSKPLTVKFNL